MKKITKAKYPEKTSMNLVMREDEGGNPKVTIAAFVIFLIALGIFTKFGVIDRMMEASKAEAAYSEASAYLEELKGNNQNYDDVADEYNKVGSAFLNDEERATLDRMDVFSMLEASVFSRTNVSSVNITGTTVSLTISDAQLSDISKVVADLESDPRTDYVTVSTAATNEQGTSSTGTDGAASNVSQIVTADMVINLQAGGDAS
ncbi:MAG: hypothetical protein PHC41_02270 [Lachnospiraceae bacterium]|nr:hypothetical protein [Lachnospiraceae bacterium]MDD3615035.1 hypothetical protein [Lachnospiraceae bacterium]